VASYFLDSRALVKRYHREPSTDWVRALCEPRDHPPLYLSDFAQVEVVAALRRTERNKHLHHSFADATVNMFERCIALSDPARSAHVCTLIPVSPAVIALATALCHQYWDVRPWPIRSLEAVQLASAVATAVDLSDELIFVTADVR
jgi:predicted nucleic acid-binding protein